MIRSSSLSGGGLRTGLERLSELPNGPDDAGHFVGHGNGGLVVTAAALDIESPEAETVGIGFGLCSPQHGARTVDEQHSEIDVAARADSAQLPPSAAGMFAGCQTQIAGEVTTGGEARDIADETDQSRGGQQANAGDRAKPFNDGSLGGQRVQMLLDGLDS